MALDAGGLRTRLGGLDATDLPNAVADEAIASALREINRYYARKTTKTFTTTTGDATYTAATLAGPTPENTVDVLWHPAGGTVDDGDYLRPLEVEVERYDDPTMRALSDLENAEQIQRSRGKWRWDGDTLVLMPQPDGVRTVVVTYRADFATTADLPDRLIEQFWRWAKAQALEAMAASAGEIIEVTEGTQRFKRAGGTDRMNMAQSLKQEFIRRAPRY